MKQFFVFYLLSIATSIQERRLFFPFTKFLRLLMKGGFHSRNYGILFRVPQRKLEMFACLQASTLKIGLNVKEKNTFYVFRV